MQRSSEFPLFFQTAIALFGFLFLIAISSSISAPKSNMDNSAGITLQIVRNLKVSV
ncbi:hypothetical protein JOY44_07635 [Phormidium sp. CLA17]|uniref:hypothetical protein n=1 Tax=Leptolyngbya sp. Cla-17 TaxID=2803751 RepID=UPI001492AA98|nr:hypothetical protein [Leptolyngbya sp. Cla-17]MBM0741486.1 hypothetical protein [Leptolyngbya sp. Cla-17]